MQAQSRFLVRHTWGEEDSREKPLGDGRSDSASAVGVLESVPLALA